MIDIEKVVRAQISLLRTYDIRADREHRPDRAKEGNLSYGPYLLISREKGAGGSAVGQMVGKRMDWQVFDGQLVDAIAERAHVRRELIEILDEHDRTMIQDAVAQLVDPEQLDTSGYMACLHETLLALGHHGHVVIVGRGAQFVLPGKFGLRVRMIAPVEVRIGRIATERGIGMEAARIEVEQADRERTKLAHRHARKDVRDPSIYDVIMNTGDLTVEAATEVVIAALKAKLGAKPTVY